MKERKKIISLMLLFLGLGFLLNFVTPTFSLLVRQYTYNITSQLSSAVGILVGVQETPINKLAQELTNYEVELNDRETILNERETSIIREEEQSKTTEKYVFVSIIIGILVLILVMLNFYLDWKRVKGKGLSKIRSVVLKRKK